MLKIILVLMLSLGFLSCGNNDRSSSNSAGGPGNALNASYTYCGILQKTPSLILFIDNGPVTALIVTGMDVVTTVLNARQSGDHICVSSNTDLAPTYADPITHSFRPTSVQ